MDVIDIDHGQMIGAVEAAKYLGVHRSTVHLAIKHNELIPDMHTPRGHVRFSLATLDAYRTKVNNLVTRARMTTSGARVSLRELLLARLMRMAASDAEVEEICHEAISGVMSLRSDLSAGYVAERVPDKSDPYALKPIAQQGIPRSVAAQYGFMRPKRGFGVISVMATGQMECCNDTSAPGVHEGTDVIMAQLGGRAYLAMPLAGAEHVIGLMGFISKQTHAFSEEDKHYFTIISDLLASRLHDRRHRNRLAGLLQAAGGLAETALSAEATPGVDALRARLRDLAGVYRAATGAYAVCSNGLMADIRGDDAFVEDLALTARMAYQDGSPEEEPSPVRVSQSGERTLMGIRAIIPLLDEGPAAIASAWREMRSDWAADLAMLNVLAAACALAQARTRLLEILANHG